MQYRLSVELLNYAKILVSEGLVRKGDCISIKLSDGSMLITNENKDLSDLTHDDITAYPADAKLDSQAQLHQAIYNNKKNTNAIITNHANYCTVVASVEKKLPAVLDDMAQIVGPTAKVAKSASIKDILIALKGRNACLVKNGGAIATGRTLDEAYTGSLVLEKGAKAFVEATVLGGAKAINYFESLLMRFIYKTKYSKADQTAKMEELK